MTSGEWVGCAIAFIVPASMILLAFVMSRVMPVEEGERDA